MNIFRNLFNRNSESNRINDFGTYQIRIEKKENWNFEPNIGSSLNAWVKTNTNAILFYLSGTIGGDGFIGAFESKYIADHIRNEGLVFAKIVDNNSNSFIVEVDISKMTKEDIEKQRIEDFIERINKPYKPKKDWSIKFNMVADFKPSEDLKINYLDLNSNVIENQESLHDSIWIEDSQGKKISKQTYFEYDKLIRTLRAIYSDLDVKIKSINKVNGQYEFVLGV